MIPLDRIHFNPNQPRKDFAELELVELAVSIKAQGVLQPVLVRKLADQSYELVAGERRCRAAMLAGLDRIPALVRVLNEQRALEVALIENLQRMDLNPMELALGFRELSQNHRLTQEEIALRTGKDRATVANYMRLLTLEDEVQQMLRSGEMSMGHARPLIGREPITQMFVAYRVAQAGWSVRRVEQHVASLGKPLGEDEALAPPPREANLVDAEEKLARALGAKVTLKANKRFKGTITVQFNDLDEFQRIFDRLCQT
ncbi:MAG TPA: ParB/RepB/Spo0J family partition protein [Terriglobales bacterium]|nr:ParB/RepB/Spo0J family partition protein [Terriglobales bacterium]